MGLSRWGTLKALRFQAKGRASLWPQVVANQRLEVRPNFLGRWSLKESKKKALRNGCHAGRHPIWLQRPSEVQRSRRLVEPAESGAGVVTRCPHLALTPELSAFSS